MSTPVITELQWAVLAALADDYESPRSIYLLIQDRFPKITSTELASAITWLEAEQWLARMRVSGVSESDHLPLVGEALVREIEEESWRFWFGLTKKGTQVWELHAEMYSGQPKDWSNAWRVSTYPNGRGLVEGVSRAACLEGLRGIGSWRLLAEGHTDGFQAKYYKWIEGGYRIEFQQENYHDS